MSTPPIPDADPQLAGEQWLVVGQAFQHAGRHAEAVTALQQAAARLPLNLDVYRALAAAFSASGQHADAASARIGVNAMERRCAVDLFEIGVTYARHRHWDAAGHWFERALMIDPKLAAAHICMAWVLRQLDRASGSSRNICRIYRRQPAFVEAKAAARRRTVLILCSSGYANLPFRHLLSVSRNRIVRWVVDLGVPGMVRGRSTQLPHYDVVFNVVSDADLSMRFRQELTRFAETVTVPLLNQPSRIEQTTREQIVSLLDGVQDICVPATFRWESQQEPTWMAHNLEAASAVLSGDVEAMVQATQSATPVHTAIARLGMSYPVIVRPAGMHGGKGVVMLMSPEDQSKLPFAYQIYLTSYHEYLSPDGHYRKYRVIFIDREPYPYHLAIGKQWLLHYFSADMLSEPWKLEEERRFLDDPESALGKRAWAALRAIGQHMDLDYCGIDFSLLPDGRVLMFETNATMLVHPEVEEDGLRFKNVYIHKIFDALDRLMTLRIQVGAG